MNSRFEKAHHRRGLRVRSPGGLLERKARQRHRANVLHFLDDIPDAITFESGDTLPFQMAYAERTEDMNNLDILKVSIHETPVYMVVHSFRKGRRGAIQSVVNSSTLTSNERPEDFYFKEICEVEADEVVFGCWETPRTHPYREEEDNWE